MNIIVSGCSSSIGKKIIPRFFYAGHTVVGLRRGECDDTRFHKCVSIDLLRNDNIKKMGSVSAEILVLLAWETTPRFFWDDTVNFQWQDMSLKLIEIFKNSGGRKVLGIGSCAEYAWTQSTPFRETDETTPATKYGQAKLATQKGIEQIGIDFIWARIFFMFSAWDSKGKLFGDLLSACENKETYELSRPKNLLDFINVNDVVSILCNLIGANASGVYNVGNGVGHFVDDVAKEIFRQGNCDRGLLNLASKEKQTTVIANIDKLKILSQAQNVKPLNMMIEELMRERSNRAEI